jgi:hypothetical protein
MGISNPISLSNKSSWFILVCRRKLEKEWSLEVLKVVLKKLTGNFGKNFTMKKNFSVPNSFHDLFAVTNKSVVKKSRSNSKNQSLLR